MYARRIAVTGVGAVTPAGSDAQSSWEALVEGRSGVAPIARFATAGAKPSYAAEVKDFVPERAGVPRRKLKMMGRQAQLAFAAAEQACADAGLSGAEARPDATRIGVILGVGMLNADAADLGRTCYSMLRAMNGRGFEPAAFMKAAATELFPLWLLRHIPNLAAAHASIHLDAQGPSNTIATGCVAGANAIGEAARIIARGEADVMLAGGTDARVTALATLRYRDLGWLATRDDVDPAAVSAPFDEEASGFINGEGAGILVLEALEHARARGARIYAELVGYAAANDAGDMFAPDPEGRALARAIERCTSRTIPLHEIDAMFAPAPSVPRFDAAIAAALAAVLNGTARPAVTATRSLVGHTHAASAAIDCVAAVKAIETGRVPATANLRRPIADLPFVTGGAREQATSAALVAAYGFGGHAAVLAFRGCTS